MISLITAVVILGSLAMVLEAFTSNDPSQRQAFSLSVSGTSLELVAEAPILSDEEKNKIANSQQNIQLKTNILNTNEEKLLETTNELLKIQNLVNDLDTSINVASIPNINSTLINNTDSIYLEKITELEKNKNLLENKLVDLEIEVNTLESNFELSKQELTIAQEEFAENVESINLKIDSKEELTQLKNELNEINNPITIALDQKVYSWKDKIFVTVIDPSSNISPDEIDSIGNTINKNISIESTVNKIDNYKLLETGSNTGIFVGEFFLSGGDFDYDANNDQINDVSRVTKGVGPSDGMLQVNPGGLPRNHQDFTHL